MQLIDTYSHHVLYSQITDEIWNICHSFIHCDGWNSHSEQFASILKTHLEKVTLTHAITPQVKQQLVSGTIN